MKTPPDCYAPESAKTGERSSSMKAKKTTEFFSDNILLT